MTPPAESPSPDELADLILGCAEFCGWQDDGNGGQIQLWTLRKDLSPSLVKNSTVSRESLRKHFNL